VFAFRSRVDKKGAFVPGLTKEDFIILEDKVPQQIETFSDEISQNSLFVGVLVDTSASTAEVEVSTESAPTLFKLSL
jgi:hypothetical protein